MKSRGAETAGPVQKNDLINNVPELMIRGIIDIYGLAFEFCWRNPLRHRKPLNNSFLGCRVSQSPNRLCNRSSPPQSQQGGGRTRRSAVCNAQCPACTALLTFAQQYVSFLPLCLMLLPKPQSPSCHSLITR